ncbi:hypothetical protein [Caulobacter segnis]|nr:hypothetical protein [Caulobacter segnis]
MTDGLVEAPSADLGKTAALSNFAPLARQSRSRALSALAKLPKSPLNVVI